MQGNWVALVLLVVAVLILALVKARKSAKEDEEGSDTPNGESAEAPDGSPNAPERKGTPEAPLDSENAQVPWDECQRQLSEEPPFNDQMEFLSPDEAGFESTFTPEAEVAPLPESPHEANSALRREAWRLFKANYWKILLLASFIVELNLIQKFILADPSYSIILTLTGLIAWLVMLGAYRGAVRVSKGDALRPGILVYFLKGRRFFPALGLYLLQSAIMLLAQDIVQSIMFQINDPILTLRIVLMSGPGLTLSLLLAFLLRAAQIWLGVYATMWMFAMARSPERGAIESFKDGFQVGIRNFKRIFGMMAATGWPFGVVILFQLIGLFNPAQDLSMAVYILNLMLILFYGGYFVLSMAGLADQLLPDADGTPPENEPAQSPSVKDNAPASDIGQEADAPNDSTYGDDHRDGLT